MPVDCFDYLEFLSYGQYNSYAAVGITPDFFRHTLTQPLQECISSAEVFQDNRPWFAINSARFHDTPVSMASGDSFLKRCHISVYIT